jgi:hypothetical protein
LHHGGDIAGVSHLGLATVQGMVDGGNDETFISKQFGKYMVIAKGTTGTMRDNHKRMFSPDYWAVL